MAVVHKYGGDDRLAGCILGDLIVVIGSNHSWLAVEGHVFGYHREGSWQWVFKAEFASEVKIGFEKGVEAETSSQVGPIVGICYVMVISVDNIDIPPHQKHL